MAVKDFYEWCRENQLMDVLEGTHKDPIHGSKKSSYKEKVAGPRDQRADLSKDYKGHIAANGTVEPYKIVAKGKNGKPVADVAG